jgi:putative transposase
VAHENDEKKEIEAAIAHPHLVALPDEVQRQVEVLQRLEACRGQPSYGAEQRQGMDALGVSKRSLRRLQKCYRDQGIEGLKRQPRRDEGNVRVDDSWRDFILESYRNGNRGTRKTTIRYAQVVQSVTGRALEEGFGRGYLESLTPVLDGRTIPTIVA